MKGLPTTLPQERLKEIFSRFEKTEILVVGDLLLDRYIRGKVERISPEAPVPVVLARQESSMPGGAANVVYSVSALGGTVRVAGVIGKDAAGETLLSLLSARKVDASGVVADGDRGTIEKTRIIAGQQQLVRIDREDTFPLSPAPREKILRYLREAVPGVAGVVIEDYGKGVVSQELVSEVVRIAGEHRTPVFIDPKKGHRLDFTGVTVVTPNREEAYAFSDLEGVNPLPDRNTVGEILLDKWGCRTVLMTLGEEGMCIFEEGKDPLHIPTFAREVYDVSGAGDTVVAALSLAYASGAEMVEAAVIANHAAGIVVGKLGTATATREEIWANMDVERGRG